MHARHRRIWLAIVPIWKVRRSPAAPPMGGGRAPLGWAYWETFCCDDSHRHRRLLPLRCSCGGPWRRRRHARCSGARSFCLQAARRAPARWPQRPGRCPPQGLSLRERMMAAHNTCASSSARPRSKSRISSESCCPAQPRAPGAGLRRWGRLAWCSKKGPLSRSYHIHSAALILY